ncbi:hypothetical protein DOTSEDRAFT_75753 [Dothistroma septosporum NZE10]|uniref:Uncharacterized protein n=1 Tax=Dothistroma septosporum (strain NZE10 / CBS 128990) TaxID=675120 RepID=N1PCZ9_DOTSN|nr:hypothetical protein DOTSEDRAFT_75753 [Dothistroma septosporum NZE10]
MTETQAMKKRVGHERGQVLSFREFMIAMEERKRLKGTVKEHSVLQSMITAAEKGDLAREAEALQLTELANDWNHLHYLISQHRNNPDKYQEFERIFQFSRRQEPEHQHPLLRKYVGAYQHCKAHIIRRNRFMISTTSSVHARELADWYCGLNGSAERAGVIVMVDEAAKD